MTYFDQIYKQLFTTSGSEIILSEPLVRSASYQIRYENWKNTARAEELLKKTATSVAMKEQGSYEEPEVHLLTASRSNGLAISYGSTFDKEEFQFLFDLLADKIRALHYKKANADRTILSRNEQLETIEKYYFKPRQTRRSLEPMDQQFGNILVEHISANDTPVRIRLLANSYPDRNFQEARSFYELLDYLLHNG